MGISWKSDQIPLEWLKSTFQVVGLPDGCFVQDFPGLGL